MADKGCPNLAMSEQIAADADGLTAIATLLVEASVNSLSKNGLGAGTWASVGSLRRRLVI
jgi:hypothetical protein